MSSSMYPRGRFQFFPSQCTLSHHLNNVCLTKPTILSNWPPRQGARLILNYQRMLGLGRKSWTFSSFTTFLIHLSAATKLENMSEQIFSCRPLLATNSYSHVIPEMIGLGEHQGKRLALNYKCEAKCRLYQPSSDSFDTKMVLQNQQQ